MTALSLNDSVKLNRAVVPFLWDIGKQYSPRGDPLECSIPSEAILFAQKNLKKKWNKNLKSLLMPLKMTY